MARSNDSAQAQPSNPDAAPQLEMPPLPRTSASSLDQALAELPAAGTDFLDFHLLSELGRGAFGRVYLAEQGDLANRQVALKISAAIFGEPQMLAQLQHTNIVPIYSVHRAGLLQAVCMPYFGPTTLADVLKDVERQSAPPTCGAALVSMLQTTVLAMPEPTAQLPSRPAGNAHGLVRMLQSMSYIHAVLWIGGRLADGLAHAHERGILHRDLKPANILLSDDGQPMLLDFNLSEDVKQRAQGVLARLGGTLPYMAPEHLEAFQGGRRPVDARSDLYALGVILYELLAGRLPFAVPPGAPPEILPAVLAGRLWPVPALRRWNRDVTPAVESIVRHCLEPDPDRRYQTAQELREDLQRQMENRPLLHAPEPSRRERARKWARRHPRLASPLTLSTLAALVVALAVMPPAWHTWQEAAEQRRMARESHQDAVEKERLAAEKQQDARKRGDDADKLKKHADKLKIDADKLKKFTDAKDALHRFRDETHSLRELKSKLNPDYLLLRQPVLSTVDLANIAQGREILRDYDVFAATPSQSRPLLIDLPEAERNQHPKDVAELLCLLASAEAYRMSSSMQPYILSAAVYALGPSHGLGLLACASAECPWPTESASARIPLKRARDLYKGEPPPTFLAYAELVEDLLRKGARDKSAAMKEPLSAVGWACRGMVREAQEPAGALNNFEEALKIDSACLPALYHKALVLADAQDRRINDATRTLDKLLTLQPDFVDGYVLRGLLWARAGKASCVLARADAEVLLRLDGSPQRLYQAACIYAQCSQWDPADRDRALVLLEQALNRGYGHARLGTDPNLGPLWGVPEFESLLRITRGRQRH